MTMADEQTPPATQPAVEGADKLHKDDVTGEMISKSECKWPARRSSQLLTVSSEAPPEAAREGCQEGREGGFVARTPQEGEEG